MTTQNNQTQQAPSYILRQGQLEDGSWTGTECCIPPHWPLAIRHILHGRIVSEGDLIELASECGAWIQGDSAATATCTTYSMCACLAFPRRTTTANFSFQR